MNDQWCVASLDLMNNGAAHVFQKSFNYFGIGDVVCYKVMDFIPDIRIHVPCSTN